MKKKGIYREIDPQALLKFGGEGIRCIENETMDVVVLYQRIVF
jgi:hypothetical protein